MKLPEQPPSIVEILRRWSATPVRMASALQRQAPARYYHWDKLRRLDPPDGLTSEEWWAELKIKRTLMLRPLPLSDVQGAPFRFTIPSAAEELLHWIDRHAAGRIASTSPVAATDSREQYLVDSLIEEAITSSQLEGASTTRLVAEDMIRSGRRPATHDEQMIANNFAAMQQICVWRDVPVTIEHLLELHRILTTDTLVDPKSVGRLRRDDERIEVVDNETQLTVHRPPPAAQLRERLAKLCTFANQPIDATPFVHPVARAVLLHFWLAYDHPFVDGNGRTARALFYWQMAQRDYWLMEFASISAVLKSARARYARSFLYTETDENDATYFLLSQLAFVKRAIDALHTRINAKQRELEATEALLRKPDRFNYRQRTLLTHALRKATAVYTVQAHQTTHQVTYETARTDLLDLEKAKLLVKTKSGKTFYFRPTANLRDKLRKL